MKKYISFFRIRFTTGLQYRGAALGGIITQFFWGFMTLLMYRAFYRSNAMNFPMEFHQLASYIWLQQGLLAMFAPWFWEADIGDAIVSGNIAYELCRPTNLYIMWFIKTIASRLSRTALRSLPIFIIAALLPSPYGLRLPPTWESGIFFIISTTLALLVVVSVTMLMYLGTFYTLSSIGIRIVVNSLVEFCSGALIPLNFLPRSLGGFLELLPFAAMQNAPLRIYVGNIAGSDAIQSILLQLFWAVLLIAVGLLMAKATFKRVVVQGG